MRDLGLGHGRSSSLSSVAVGVKVGGGLGVCPSPWDSNRRRYSTMLFNKKRLKPSSLKIHYSEMVNVAERLSKRIFSRTQSYDLQKRQKDMGIMPPDSWVRVHHLRQTDGGILDGDDVLTDVADDREQIVAVYDELTAPQQGDGTSGSSDESENQSPNIFKNSSHTFEPFSRNDIEITGEALNCTPPPLHVRRGSEPALNRLSPIPCYPQTTHNAHVDPTKRWSAAPIIDDQPPASSTPLKDKELPMFDDYPGERGEGSGEEKNPSTTSSGSSAHSATTNNLKAFSRDGTNRCSVQILNDNNPSLVRWAEAAERLHGGDYQAPISGALRREPVGGVSTPQQSRNSSLERISRGMNHNGLLVTLLNDGYPLGIHVIPSTDLTGNDQGLLVEGIEPEGRVAKDGRIRVHDIIVEINKKTLRNVTFQQAQEIFKDAMRDPELKLLVTQRKDFRRNPEIQSRDLYVPHIDQVQPLADQERFNNINSNSSSAKRLQTTSLSSRTQNMMLQSNTRRIGKRLKVDLVKGPHGLGFSITTRDNPAGGEAPIYIKNILPRGAAIEDGKLRIGDRLLEVNETQVTGYSQSQVADLLRRIPVGSIASLTVSRQEKVTDSVSKDAMETNDVDENCPSPKLPRQMPIEKAATEDSLLFPWKQREIFTFEIPVHDSERAGLGVSVKGKTSSGPNGSVDLGIFVKNVIHGGAASRDGRLMQNDQLVNINGLSLLGKSNSQAMKTLRTAMNYEYCHRSTDSNGRSYVNQPFLGPTPGVITLTVARRVDQNGFNTSGRDSVNSLGTTSSGGETFGCVTIGGYGGSKSTPVTPTPQDNSGTSDHSDNTVIFNVGKDSDFDPVLNGISHIDPFALNNPVIQRLTGNNNAALRNESYYKATHDTWNSSQIQPHISGPKERIEVRPHDGGNNHFGSPTINPQQRETLIIHDEYDMAQSRQPIQSIVVPVSYSQIAYSDQPSNSSDAYNSQTSLEDGGGFSRDQFGRQSMSEKRHATLDAKSTDTYQRNKKVREDREKHRNDTSDNSSPDGANRSSRSSKDIGPGLGMKKSSSLESLQTMVQEMALEDECQRANGGSGRVPRGRGCNESFRAAVDRSYDAPLANGGTQMETLAEEESESGGSGFGRGNSRQSSLSSTAEERLRKATAKKNKGIFKGLGTMFRFGKHRKSLEHHKNYHEGGPLREDDGPMGENDEDLRDQHGRLVDNGIDDGMPTSRSARMHMLRAEHQRRHQQRNGTYPTDPLENRYDADNKRLEPVPSEPKPDVRHIRSRSHDTTYTNNTDPLSKKNFGRPGQRTGFVDPNKFAHYVNYEQIQMHLRQNKEQDRLAKLASRQYQDFRDKQTSREQREYQSQRGARENSYQQQRPASNYFEYESVQAMMSHAQERQASTSSLPRRGPAQMTHNANMGPPIGSNVGHGGARNSNIGQHNVSVNAKQSKQPSSKGPPPPNAIHNQRSKTPQNLFPNHNRGQAPLPPPLHAGAREGVYAASGYRPASQYGGGLNHRQMHQNSSLVPGSKV